MSGLCSLALVMNKQFKKNYDGWLIPKDFLRTFWEFLMTFDDLLMNFWRISETFLRTFWGLSEDFLRTHGALRGSRQGLFPPRRFILLNQQLGNDLTGPLSATYLSWSEESAAAPAAGTSWPRLSPQSSERSWRPLTLDGNGWNVLYLISCQLRLIHSGSIDIWTSTALST